MLHRAVRTLATQVTILCIGTDSDELSSKPGTRHLEGANVVKRGSMRIGVPKEIKNLESRVGLTPASVREVVAHGHQVLVERNAAARIALSDDDYSKAGATLIDTPDEIFARADLIVKVKEPQPAECLMLREGQTIFTYLHLAPDAGQAEALMKSGVTAIAYETVTSSTGGLPLLAPMSEVAGRMSIQCGAHCLEIAQGGRGLLLGGVAGVAPAKVVVLGAGIAGINATHAAIGLEADVTLLDINIDRLYAVKQQFGSAIKTLYSTRAAIEEQLMSADLVIGAVLIPGAAAPKLISRQLVADMPRGSVIVDISIDQGGCADTSKPTTHAKPTYVVDEVVHYCVANMPGAVARTSTFALNNVTLPFVMALADKGPRSALLANDHLLHGLNVHAGRITHQAVATALKHSFTDPREALRA